MSSVETISLSSHLSSTMGDVFSDINANASLQLEQQDLHILSASSTTKALELVVFSDLTVEQFLALLEQCQLNLEAFNQQNCRLNRSSLRFSVQAEDLTKARIALSDFCLAEQCEAALVENAPKLTEQGLLVMDMDSTTIEIECIDEIAKLAGVGEQVAEVTERAMQGELDFAESLHHRVATLANAPESILAAVAQDIPLMDGLVELIDELKQHNWKIAIASGGFTYFADHLKHMLSLDDAVANTLEIINGKLTGKVLGAVIDANAKAGTLKNLSEKYHISPTQTVAMGDGANDLVMMEAAHLGVAFRAKPIVQSKADSALHLSGLSGMVHWLK